MKTMNELESMTIEELESYEDSMWVQYKRIGAVLAYKKTKAIFEEEVAQQEEE